MTEQSVPPPTPAESSAVAADDTSAYVYTTETATAVTAEEPAVAVDRAPSLVAKVGAEFFGTFVLIFLGVGAAVFASVLDLGQLGVGIAFAIGLTAAIAAVGHVSQGSFNPAVSLGLMLSGRISWKEMLAFWPAQLAGGAFATLVLWAAAPRSFNVLEGLQSSSRADLFQGAANGFGTHSPGFNPAGAEQLQTYLDQGYTLEVIQQATDTGQLSFPPSMEIGLIGALIIEVVATAIFVGVILAVTDSRSKNRFQAVVIGLTLGALLIVTIPLTNGSINPARSFAAAIFAGDWAWSQLWLFIVAPLLGAAIAALFYRGFAFGITDRVTVTDDPAGSGIDGLQGGFFEDATASGSDNLAGQLLTEDSRMVYRTETGTSSASGVSDAQLVSVADLDAGLSSAPAVDETSAADAATDAVVESVTDEAADDDEPEGDTVLR